MGYPSYFFGRIGSFHEETGLFALEGGVTDFGITRDSVLSVGGTRNGYEINSRAPFGEGNNSSNVQFFNKTTGYCTTYRNFQAYVEASTVSGSVSEIASEDFTLIYNLSQEKKAARRYVSQFVGLVPKERAVKTILKARGMPTKRIVLFGGSVHPDDGGATWIVSPTGFPWRDTKKHILDDATQKDIEKCIGDPNFLFMTMTGTVPFISGHRQRQPDEEWPRLLRIPPCNEKYHQLLSIHLFNQLSGKTNSLSESQNFMELCSIEAAVEGNKVITTADLADDFIDLSDVDFMV